MRRPEAVEHLRGAARRMPWWWSATARSSRSPSSISRRSASSTCTPRCCRSTAARRPSSGPSRTAKRAPASPPCGSTPGSTPATCCSRRETADRPRGDRARTGRAPGRHGRGPAGRDARRPRAGHRAAPSRTPPQATLAPILKKEDGLIDWSRPPREIHNRVRGFQPWPGAYTRFRGQTLHIWKSRVAARAAPRPPGAPALPPTACWRRLRRGHALELLEVQLEGRKRVRRRRFRQRAAPGRQ